MASNSEKRQALVKWAGGRDDGKLDIIPTAWIKNFDEGKWKSTSEDDRETEVAEWKHGKKTPGGTYLSYDCQVLLCSSKYPCNRLCLGGRNGSPIYEAF